MAGEWAEVALSELTDPETPITYGVVKPGLLDPDGVLFIRGGDIADGRVLTKQLRTITKGISHQYRRTLLRGGEIVVSLVGNPGQIAIVPESLHGANIARQVGLVRLKSNVDTRFVKYYLSSPKGQEALGAQSSGSVQQVINLGDLKTVRVPTPPLSEQRAIARILGALDDKIELNRRMNETLEAMARALFKSWFIDFDPVHAKAEGHDPSLPADIAALFPNSFEDSGLGEIPKGWELDTFGALLSLAKGLSYKGEFLSDTGVPMVNLGCFPGQGRFKREAMKRYLGGYQERHTVKPGDLVLANTDITQRREVIGSPGIVPQVAGSHELIFTHHVYAARFRGGKQQWKPYVFFYLLSDQFRQRATGFATGTTVLALPREAITDCQFPEPPDMLIQAFNRLVAPFQELSWQVEEQSISLTALRDTLLPRLLSGDLRVKDVDQSMEAHQ